MLEKLRQALERWERDGRIDDGALDSMEQDFEAWLDAELGEIAQLASAGQGEAALARLTRLNAFASAAAARRPTLANAIGAKFAAFRNALQSVGWSLGAVEFSLTLGVPVALSVTFAFRVTPPGAEAREPTD